MAAIKIDPNYWQEIYPSSAPGLDLFGTWLFNKNASATFPFETGSTFLSPPANDGTSQQWQFFPLNYTTYALRTKESGPKGFLNTQFVDNWNVTGNTAVNMRNSTITDDAMLWNIGYWADGSLFFTNVANGTAWLLSFGDSANTLMAPNSSSPGNKPGQSWQIRGGEVINDSAYSVVLGMPINTASPTSSSPSSTATSTATSMPSSSSSPASPQGLSSGASAGIGVGVAAVAIIAAASLIFFFLRRRKVKRLENQSPTPIGQPGTKQELYSGPIYPTSERSNMLPVEMGDREVGTPVAELMDEPDGHRPEFVEILKVPGSESPMLKKRRAGRPLASAFASRIPLKVERKLST